MTPSEHIEVAESFVNLAAQSEGIEIVHARAQIASAHAQIALALIEERRHRFFLEGAGEANDG